MKKLKRNVMTGVTAVAVAMCATGCSNVGGPGTSDFIAKLKANLAAAKATVASKKAGEANPANSGSANSGVSERKDEAELHVEEFVEGVQTISGVFDSIQCLYGPPEVFELNQCLYGPPEAFESEAPAPTPVEEPAPTTEAPAPQAETPSENQQVENPPAENPPVENPQTETPAENPPVENQPAENQPAENQPAENQQVENPPAENQQVENPPSEEPPIELEVLQAVYGPPDAVTE